MHKVLSSCSSQIKPGQGGSEMKIWFVAAGLACLSTPLLAQEGAQTQDTKRPLMVSFTDLKWVELPQVKGTQFAALSGDPKTGPFTQMRKIPAGTDNGLHSHSSEITMVVISGVLYVGPDATSAKDFGPGSVIVMPADWVHVSGCRPGSDCIFYQEGRGKFDYKPSAKQGRNK
jgi:quercetin dioxygenase-like cupin family protein